MRLLVIGTLDAPITAMEPQTRQLWTMTSPDEGQSWKPKGAPFFRDRRLKLVEAGMPISESSLAQLAVEYWKLLRAVERALEAMPESSRARMASQARYASARLDALLSAHKMSLQAFDGFDFEVNLPASAINAEDFQNNGTLVVERTLEPAVIFDMRVLLMGKVLLARKD
jgi:hypothetical protein